MADPTPYNISYSFGDWQTDNPTLPLPAVQVDNELAGIEASIDSLVSGLMNVRRSDGKLKNAIVTKESLAADVYLGFGVPTVWASATNYLKNNTVFHDSKFYKANTEHTSGVSFADDIANWDELADLSGAVIADSGTLFTAVDTAKTGDYTIVAGDAGKALVANKASAIVFTFDVVSNLLSKAFLVKNIGAGDLTLRAAASESIEGVANPAGLTLPTGWSAFVWGTSTTLRAIVTPGTADIIRGPASSTADNILTADGSTGKKFKDSAVPISYVGRFMTMAERIETADYTIVTTDAGKAVIANKATAISFALPAVASAGTAPYFVRNIGAGDLTIDPDGAETIEGASTLVLKQGCAAIIWPNGTLWRAFQTERVATQAEATAGTAQGVYMDPLRVAQAVAAQTTLPVPGGRSGLKVEAVSASQVTITANYLVLHNNSGGAVRLSSVNVTAALSSSGANGLDTGSEAGDTWYNAFVIYNPTTLTAAGLLSTSATSPTLPSGYTYFEWVGAVRNDGSSNLWRTLQYGHKTQIRIGTNPTALPLMKSGTGGSIGSGTYASQSVSSFVPPTATHIAVEIFCYAAADAKVAVAPNNSYGAVTSSTNGPPLTIFGNGSVPNGHHATMTLMLESTNLYYAADHASSGMRCLGWEINL